MWCKSRRVPAIIVGVFAGILFLFGVAMIVLSLEFNFSFENMQVVEKYKNMMFIILIIGSLLAVISSVLASVIACKQRHWCLHVNVGIFMFIAWILLVFSGVVMGVVSFTSEETFLSFCNKETAPKSGFGRFMKDIIDKTDSSVGSQVSAYMCSSVCPCAPPGDVVIQWTSMTQTELATYKRAPALANSSADGNGYQRLFFTSDPQYKVYDTFLDCQTDILKGDRVV